MGQKEHILLICVIERDAYQIRSVCRFCSGCQMQRKLNWGNHGCKKCGFLKISVSKRMTEMLYPGSSQKS